MNAHTIDRATLRDPFRKAETISLPFILFATFLLAGCATSERANREALVIGNSEYSNPGNRLTNAVNDADDVCATLRKLRFRTECHKQVRTKSDFEAIVSSFGKRLNKNTKAVFYYSGHGAQVASENYLIPTNFDSTSSSKDAQPYSLNNLFDVLRSSNAAFKMVILDACRNDPITEKKSKSSENQAIPDQINKKGFLWKNLVPVGGMEYGLATITDIPQNSVVLYATAAKDSAFDGSDGYGRHGPLTDHFLRHVRKVGLEHGELITLIKEGVGKGTEKIYNKPQRPESHSNYPGKFWFAPDEVPLLPTP